jgi:hypothetical protein
MAADAGVQAQDRQTGEGPPGHSAGLMLMIVPPVEGLVVGAAASWALLFGTLDRATPITDGFLYWSLPVLGVSAAVIGFGISYLQPLQGARIPPLQRLEFIAS